MKLKFKYLMMAFAAILCMSLQSCCDDCTCPDNTKVYTAPSFTTTNVSASGEKSLTASDNKVVVNLNYKVTITINGEPTIFSGSCNSNELPVISGNEVEVKASFDENRATDNICFTMPDGSKRIVTKDNPSCIWIVPANFMSGDKITAQWADNSGKIQYANLLSTITLIDLNL